MNNRVIFGVYGEMYFVELNEVMYFEADDHYTNVYYSSGSHFMIPFGLSKVDQVVSQKLTDEKFIIRVGRKYMINLRNLYHINTQKQVVQLLDNNGHTHTLSLPKMVLRDLLQCFRGSALPDDADPEEVVPDDAI